MELNGDKGNRTRERSARTVRRSRGAVSLAVCGLAVLAVSFFGIAGAGAAEDGDAAAPVITITQEPIVVDGECNPLAQAQLTYTTESTDEFFRLVVTSATDPCEPIAAAAVAYAMPAGATPDGGQWPQTLEERVDFTISEASVTTITFAKDCAALQFDVITGESPATISPTGPWHGPLLFVGDVNTSQQYFPPAEQCGGTTTTTSTTTTVPATVLPATTLPQVATNVVSPTVVVADTSVTRGSNDAAALALTGSSSGRLALLGGSLLVAGVAMFAWSRRAKEQ